MHSPEKSLRKQVRVLYPGQLLTPADLSVGQDIACLEYLPGQLRSLRALYAAARFMTAKLRQGSTPRRQLAAAYEGWKTEADASLTPLWRGSVEKIGKERVSALLTHGRFGEDFSGEYTDHPEQIPPLDGPDPLMKMSETFADMGLAPIPVGEEHAGRWLPYVTVVFPE